MSGACRPCPGGPTHRELPTADTLRPASLGDTEDDLALFRWLIDQIERFEARPDAGVMVPEEVTRRRVRGLRRAAAMLAARLDED